MAKAKLGSGERFQDLEEKLKKRKGVKHPGAMAPWTGRERYGSKKMAEPSHHKKGS